MGEYEDKKSKFNAGVLLTSRLHELQATINMCRYNPMAPNLQTGRFNYEVMISALDSLLNECWAKLSPTEQKEGYRMQNLINKFVKFRPPITTANKELKVNNKNHEDLMKLLDLYEKMIKTFLDTHDLNAPNREEDDEGL